MRFTGFIRAARGAKGLANRRAQFILSAQLGRPHDHRLPRPLHDRAKALEDWRNRQIAAIGDASLRPSPSELSISDDELRETIETNQLRQMRARGSDLTIFSPRASFMAHHIGDFEVSSTWASICNELIHRVVNLFPQHFIGAAMLPQSPGVDPKTCVAELDRCIRKTTALSASTSIPTRRAGTGEARR